MTLPHGLARAVLIEQIYRAATILSGHPHVIASDGIGCAAYCEGSNLASRLAAYFSSFHGFGPM